MCGWWLASGAKPSTLADYQYMLAKAGVPTTQGEGVLAGHATAARADRPAARITTCEVEDVLAAIRATYADRGRQTPGRREPTTPGVLPRGFRASALR